jgi:hypothetical protein
MSQVSRGQDRDQAMLPSEAEPLVDLRRSLATTENGRTGESCEPSWFAVTVQTPARLFTSESLLDACFVSAAIAAIGSPLARSEMKPRASAMKIKHRFKIRRRSRAQGSHRRRSGSIGADLAIRRERSHSGDSHRIRATPLPTERSIPARPRSNYRDARVYDRIGH